MKKPKILVTIAILAGVLCIVGQGGAQSVAALSSDGTQMIIQKDVGEDRWSITLRMEDGYVVGNVMTPTGSVFLACDLKQQTGGNLTHVCSSYEGSRWEPLVDVTQPETFWFPDDTGV